jgi:hypothetical protein
MQTENVIVDRAEALALFRKYREHHTTRRRYGRYRASCAHRFVVDSPLEGERDSNRRSPLEPCDLAMIETARGFRRPARTWRHVKALRRRSILRA